jgi:signal transduction histidine kinase/ActR/RegA family two-component response regulator
VTKRQSVHFYIFAIAGVGSLAFLVYLSVNMLQARDTEQRVNQLTQRDYPVMVELTQLLTDAYNLREGLANAILLRNRFLIDDVLENAGQVQARLQRIRALSQQQTGMSDQTEALFSAYLDEARALALALTTAELKSSTGEGGLISYQESATHTHQAFGLLETQIKGWLAALNADYEADMLEIGQQLKGTYRTAIMAGLLVIIGLGIMAWGIASRVWAAIESSDRLKEGFLATISHELRTPINGIMGNVALLKKTELSSEQKDLVDLARVSSMEMLKTVDEILTFTEFFSGTPPLRQEPVDLHACLTNTLRIMSDECRKRGLEFVIDIEAATGLTILTDEPKLIHILRRLLENAYKFTQQGRIAFDLKAIRNPLDETRAEIMFSVTDSGPGIKQAHIEAMFRPFHQLDGSFTRKYGGLGIGLAICKAVSDCLKGRLSFDNRADSGGAIVTFQFPATIQKASASASTSASASASASQIPLERSVTLANKTPGAPPLVLIVEDNRVNQAVLDKMLKKIGARTALAGNGVEALDRLKLQSPDLILMDCQMPVMDGFDATERIRHLGGSLSQLPIIAVTANTMEADRQRCLKVGMNDFISKPVDLTVLKERLAAYINLPEESENG